MVTTSMTVPVLAQSIARLLSVSSPLALFVSPLWTPLDHAGFIVSRFLPGTNTPCPYLQPGSILRVLVRTRLVRLPSSSSELTISGPDSARFDNAVSARLVRTDLSFFPALGLDGLSRPDNLSSTISSLPRNGENHDDVDVNMHSTGENHEDGDARGGVSSLPRNGENRVDSDVNLQRNGENPEDGENGDVRGDVFRRVSFGLPILTTSSVAGDNIEWGQSYGPLVPDSNFAPTQWRRFEWGESGNIQGPESEPTSWGRGRPKRSPSSSSSSFGEQRSSSSSGSGDSNGVSFHLQDGEQNGEHHSQAEPSLEQSEESAAGVSMADSPSDEDTPPSPKRIRSEVHQENDSPPNDGMMDAAVLTRVTRREQAILLKKFRREQRLERRRYKGLVRAMWDEELANEKNRLEDDKKNEQGSSSEVPPPRRTRGGGRSIRELSV
jgi:hypothetical protein